LHDVGHLLGLEAGKGMQMEGCGFVDHELKGATFLQQLGFGSFVCEIVRNHVNAKR